MYKICNINILYNALHFSNKRKFYMYFLWGETCFKLVDGI